MQPFEVLEQKFGEWIENDNTVAVSSGTAALHLACEVLYQSSFCTSIATPNIILPEFTMVACARAVTMAGCTPIFRDCYDNLLMVQEDPKGSPVMAVHVYGRKDNLDRYHMSDEVIIEDLAEGHGIQPHPKSFAACWSFYKNKIVRGEEGGMIAFKDKQCADLARKLRSLGFDSAHNYMHVPRGINARMSNLHATPILESLRNVKENLTRRKEVAKDYNERIPERWRMPDTREVDWVYDLHIPRLSFFIQDMIVKKCREIGLEARHGFKPMSIQPEYASFKASDLELNAYRLASEVIYLPIDPTYTSKTVEDNVNKFMGVCRSIGIVP